MSFGTRATDGTRTASLSALSRGLAIAGLLAVAAAGYARTPPGDAECAAYFFMAANAKSMGEFDDYYRAGEFAYNRAVELTDATGALEQFNRASQSINELIERNWNYFERADERYGVLCADRYREANRPRPLTP